MMEKIKIVILGIGVIGSLIILFTIAKRIGGAGGQSEYLIKELIRTKDDLIKHEQERVIELKDQATKLSEEIYQHRRNDSILSIKQKALHERVNNIPAIVRNYNREELRSAALDFE